MKCPTCFYYLPAGPIIRFQCTGPCPPSADARAARVRGYEVLVPPTFDVDTTMLAPGTLPSCPTCDEPGALESCRECGAAIPVMWRSATVSCIAMAGARATGKSLTLAVAKEQLALLVERHHGSTLRAVGDTQEFFRTHYAQHLYEERSLLAPTASMSVAGTSTRQSMIFQFTERMPNGSARLRVVVLRDVAGEDLEAQGDADAHLGFFARADAVIALLDPLAVRQVKEMLADLIPGDTRIGGDGLGVVRHVLDLMNEHRQMGRTPIPIAIVLSKFDTLQALRAVEATDWQAIMNRPGAPLQRDPSLTTPHYDHTDGDLLHEEVRGLLDKLEAGQLGAMLEERAEHYRFFAVSALGASPKGALINSGGIAPFRVLDPFKWALAVTG